MSNPFKSFGGRFSMLRSRGGYWLLLFVALVLPLVLTPSFFRHIMTMTVMCACMAQAWNIVGGYAGQIALGNVVFFGLGAYSAALGFVKFGLSPWLGLLIGIVVSATVAAVIGWASFKTSGIYFAIATLGIGELARTLFVSWRWAEGSVGIEMPILPSSVLNFQFHGARLPYYYMILGLLVLYFWIVARIGNSRFGYYLRTISVSEVAAEAVGIDVLRYMMLAFVLAAVMTSICGTFYNQYLLYIDPWSVFPSTISMLMLFITVFGGVGTAIGPVIGAVILIPLGELTRGALGGQGKGIDYLINAVLMVTVTILEPRGVLQLIRRAPLPWRKERTHEQTA
jgi:branched-chain amino acid transport system permease protein